jgi:hypothetical protein
MSAGNFAMNKCRHMLFGQQFVWVTDCYVAKFVLSYESAIPAILWLQMRLMCWDVNIVHRPDSQLVNADYWSRLGSDIKYNPLLCDHLEFTMNTWAANPLPTKLPMCPENMPYFRGLRFQATASLPDNPDELHIQTLLTNIIVHQDLGHTHLSHLPVKFGHLSDDVSIPKLGTQALLNSKFAW